MLHDVLVSAGSLSTAAAGDVRCLLRRSCWGRHSAGDAIALQGISKQLDSSEKPHYLLEDNLLTVDLNILLCMHNDEQL